MTRFDGLIMFVILSYQDTYWPRFALPTREAFGISAGMTHADGSSSGGRDLREAGPKSAASCALGWGRLVAILVFVWFTCQSSSAGDYVVVVDTSGTMTEAVSRTNRNIRIQVVQVALTNFINQLQPGSRVRLISFNTGVASSQELVIRDDSDRQAAHRWIAGLERESRKKGATHLCSTIRIALSLASAYSAERGGQPVRVWALTDGMDNEPGPGTESGTQERLNRVLREFPDIDEDSIQADLTILGRLALTITSDRRWFRIRTDVGFENVVPPVIQWSPSQPKAGEELTLLENSPAAYRLYEWRVDGLLVGTEKIFRTNYPSAGTHRVELTVTAANWDKLTDRKQITVAPATEPERPRADFVVVPSMPEPGAEVRFIGQPRGKPIRFDWTMAGQRFAETEVATHVFAKEGTFEVRFRVEDAAGQSDERSQTLRVQEAPLQVRFSADAESSHGQTNRFVNLTSGGKVQSYAWDFGDGTQSVEEHPSHAFQVPGREAQSYTVRLRATTPLGKTYDSEPFHMKIWPGIMKPTAAFSVMTNRIRAGATLQFVNQSTGLILSNVWRFGTEGTTSEPSPLWAFNEVGANAVSLTVIGPGGSDTATTNLTVVKPESDVLLKWIGADGRDAPLPTLLDFGRIHPNLALSGEYARPRSNDCFEVLMPAELPPDAGLTIHLDEPVTKAIQVVPVLLDSQMYLPTNGLIQKTGRYRLEVRRDAVGGEHSGSVVFAPRGEDVRLAVLPAEGSNPISTNAARVPVRLQVGTTSVWPVLVFLVLIGAVAAGLLARQLRKPIVPPQRPMEVTLRELPPATASGAGSSSTVPARTYVLSVNHRIRLGDALQPGLPDHVYNLGAPDAALRRTSAGLSFHASPTAKETRFRGGGELSFRDKDGKPRRLSIAVREAANPPNPHRPKP